MIPRLGVPVAGRDGWTRLLAIVPDETSTGWVVYWNPANGDVYCPRVTERTS